MSVRRGRTRANSGEEGRRAPAPRRRPARLPRQRRHEAGRSRRRGCACAPPPPAAGARADHGDARASRRRDDRRRDARRLLGSLSCSLPSPSTASGSSPASSRRRTTASSSDPLDGAAAPPARRQGDRDRAARARAARARRRARRRRCSRRRLRAPASLGGNLALVVPWFALGFALYAVAYAAAGALASRQQDANSAGQPVTYTLLAAYFSATSPSPPTPTACSRTCSPSSRSPRRSSSPPGARSSACRSGNTRSRSCSCSPRSTRSSGSPAASTQGLLHAGSAPRRPRRVAAHPPRSERPRFRRRQLSAAGDWSSPMISTRRIPALAAPERRLLAWD